MDRLRLLPRVWLLLVSFPVPKLLLLPLLRPRALLVGVPERLRVTATIVMKSGEVSFVAEREL